MIMSNRYLLCYLETGVRGAGNCCEISVSSGEV